ncbi:hypothetical protein BDW59DRAFT_177316 [Aspergillus cavernicola]|uniref:ZZ-type domain-containing protein n=1 Tax=Aspergillus cavernicola TaxID=176166 RepID=A0ABR4HMG2_9EURO
MEIAGVAIGVVGLLALYEEASLRLTSRYNATKILFERWGKQAVHPHLKDQSTASVVADLLRSIRDYHDQTSPLHLRSRLKWAVADYGKLSREAEDFDELVQKLYLLVPIESLQPLQFPELQDALFQSERSHALGRILRWLDAPSIEDNFDAYCSTRLDTTCQWITAHPTYKDWLSDQPLGPSKSLWVHGPGGFGKSVLCAYIIQLLRDAGKVPVYYAFCSADNESQRNPISILRTWIVQAVCNDESVLDMVYRYLGSSGTTMATHSDLWHLLQEILSHSLNAVLVVDGLDECPRTGASRTDLHRSREDILHKILGSIADQKARLLVVSREEGDIKAQLGPHAPRRAGITFSNLSLTKDIVAPDVARFAEHIITQKLPEKTNEDQQELAAQMAEKCDGMFLWIRLQSRNLRSRKTNKQLQRVINEMPTDLVRIYERDWADIQSFSGADRQRSEAILRWTVFAHRPLTVAELSEAVAVLDTEEDGPQFDELPSPFDEEHVHSEILGPCGSFLELRPASTGDWGSQTVHLVHFSAVEFLSGQQSSGPFSDPMLHNYYLARDCLRYIDCEESWQVEKDESRNIIYKRPFSIYAISAWYEHLMASQWYRHKIQPQLKSFFGLPNPNWDHWREHYEAYHGPPPQAAFGPGGRIYYAAAFGGIADVNEVGGRHGSPAQAASAWGNTDVLEFLIDVGADITAHGQYGSALHAAVACNQQETALALLQHGASISATDNRAAQILINRGAELCVTNNIGWNPLYCATALGNIEIVKLFLDHGADFSLTTDQGETPLHISAGHGHNDILKTLLDRGADIEAKTLQGSTALYYAAQSGHIQTCQLLLDNSATPTTSHKDGLTALHAALLLDAGADIEASDEDGYTPLDYAAWEGRHEAVKFLLDCGADHTASANDGFTPLHSAAENGPHEVVKTLLDCGADPAASANNGYTPLHSAAEGGHCEIVELLLESGSVVSKRDMDGWTPLFSASFKGRGSDVDLPAYDGRTPLHTAFKHEYEHVVLALLENQASMTRLDLCGVAPWQYATAAFCDKIPQCKDCKAPTEDGKQHRMRQSVQAIAEMINNLARCLLLLQDFPSAHVVFNENIRIEAESGLILHHAYCDGCGEDISGNRYACVTCPDGDLCASCKTKYTEGECFGQCAGHEFLLVPSDDWNRDQVNDVYMEGFVDWLKELALRYGIESM